MFAKDKVTQSMIDAVNRVLAEKKMEDKEVEESGLRKKAHASAAAGKKSFEFLGKTLPVTVKKEEKKVEEGFGEMDKYLKDKEKEKGTGKYDKKKISTGTVYQKKHNAPKEDEKDDMKEEVEGLDEADIYSIKNTKTGQIYHHSKYPITHKTKIYQQIKSKPGHEDATIHMNGKPVKEEVELDEAVSRKHFQQVADLIKSHENPEKRKELAQHHASIFKTQNPRFDHAKFMKAAGVNEGSWSEEADCVTPPQAKKIAKKEITGHEKTMHHKEEIDTDVRTKDMLKGRKPTKQTDDVGPGSDSKSTKVRYHAGPHPSNEEVEQVEERTLTAAETKKKEHMVMSMKPKLKDFKKRYGERAKEVMYATATKRAKGE